MHTRRQVGIHVRFSVKNDAKQLFAKNINSDYMSECICQKKLMLQRMPRKMSEYVSECVPKYMSEDVSEFISESWSNKWNTCQNWCQTACRSQKPCQNFQYEYLCADIWTWTCFFYETDTRTYKFTNNVGNLILNDGLYYPCMVIFGMVYHWAYQISTNLSEYLSVYLLHCIC